MSGKTAVEVDPPSCLMLEEEAAPGGGGGGGGTTLEIFVGAGGGGYFIFYVKAKEKINFLKWLTSQNLKHTYFKFVPNGLNTWVTRE